MLLYMKTLRFVQEMFYNKLHLPCRPEFFNCHVIIYYIVWNCMYFGHPTDKQLQHLDFLFFRLLDISRNSNLPSVLLKLYTIYCRHVKALLKQLSGHLKKEKTNTCGTLSF